MNNILDQSDNLSKKKTYRYSLWSFRFFIYTLILNVSIFLLSINYMDVSILEMISLLLTFIGSIFCLLSIIYKEEKSSKKTISMIGFSILIGILFL